MLFLGKSIANLQGESFAWAVKKNSIRPWSRSLKHGSVNPSHFHTIFWSVLLLAFLLSPLRSSVKDGRHGDSIRTDHMPFLRTLSAKKKVGCTKFCTVWYPDNSVKDKKCGRHQCEARSGNVNSANETKVQFAKGQVCQCQQCECNFGAGRLDVTPKSCKAAASAFRMEFGFCS